MNGQIFGRIMTADREKWMLPIFKELFRVVSEDLTVECIETPYWQNLNTWTDTQALQFRMWLRNYLRKRSPWRYKDSEIVDMEVSFFIANYGWRLIGEEVDNGTTARHDLDHGDGVQTVSGGPTQTECFGVLGC